MSMIPPLSPTPTRALVVAIALLACVCVGRADAADAGAPFTAGSGGHVSYESTDVRADAAPNVYQGTAVDVGEGPIAGTGRSGALVITPTFDSSITGDPNSAAIQAMINSAITIYENLY